MQGGETEQWGDKWEERFKEGKGTKKVAAAHSPDFLCAVNGCQSGTQTAASLAPILLAACYIAGKALAMNVSFAYH